MQNNDNAFDMLWEKKELTMLMLQRMPVTAEGAVAMQNFRCTSRPHAVAGALTFRVDAWTKHKEGMHFVRLIALERQQGVRRSWQQVRTELDNYKKYEDVIAGIVLLLRDMGSTDSEYVMDYFHHQDTTQDVRIVGDLLQAYPRNCLIQEIGCAILGGLYEYGIQQDRFDPDHACEHCIRLAVDALVVPDRTVLSVCAGMHLLLTLHKINEHALQGFVVETGQDVMAIIFDIQYEFCTFIDVVKASSKLSKVLLPTWTAPEPAAEPTETRQNPGPVSIILACVRENPGSLYHHKVACKQLGRLALNNTGRLRITENILSCIANMIQQKTLLVFGTVYDRSEKNLWQFLDAMVYTDDPSGMPTVVFDMFQESFDIEFLLESLAFHTKYYNPMNSEFFVAANHTVGIICRMILMLVVRGPGHANRDRLLQANGIEVLMNAIDNHHNTVGDVLGAGLFPCVSLFLHMFGSDDNTAETHLTITTHMNKRELRKFKYGSLMYPDKKATLPRFVLDTLSMMIHNRFNQYGVVFTEALERTTQLFALLLGKGETFCRGKWTCWNAMEHVAHAVQNYTRVIKQEGETGVDVQYYAASVRHIITHMDRAALTLETYRENTLKSDVYKKNFTNYMIATQSYRRDDDKFEAAIKEVIAHKGQAAW